MGVRALREGGGVDFVDAWCACELVGSETVRELGKSVIVVKVRGPDSCGRGAGLGYALYLRLCRRVICM